MSEAIHQVVLFGAFAILWFLALFCMLPMGMGAEVDPETGAPSSPMLARKALWATGIALALWLVFYATIRLGLIQL